MLKIRLLVVGKTKKKFYIEASLNYLKRINRFAKISVIEVKHQTYLQKMSNIEKNKVIENESNRLISRIKNSDFVIVLEIKGKMVSSREIAKMIRNIPLRGYSTIDFIIGGSLGLSQKIKKMSDIEISFGRITLPHELAKVVLLEQIYRSFTINNGIPYHK